MTPRRTVKEVKRSSYPFARRKARDDTKKNPPDNRRPAPSPPPSPHFKRGGCVASTEHAQSFTKGSHQSPHLLRLGTTSKHASLNAAWLASRTAALESAAAATCRSKRTQGRSEPGDREEEEEKEEKMLRREEESGRAVNARPHASWTRSGRRAQQRPRLDSRPPPSRGGWECRHRTRGPVRAVHQARAPCWVKAASGA